jgi:Tol biopolymer transport system component
VVLGTVGYMSPEQVRGDDFSPDGKWVLASHGQLFLIPLGPGEPQQITHDSIQHEEASFLPDGRVVVFTGIEWAQVSHLRAGVG